MKNRKFKHLNKKLLTASILSAALFSQTQAASLPAGSVLGLDAGAGAATNIPCLSGSCFGMEVAPGLIIWINVNPGTDGGFVVGKNQASGGQELAPNAANTTSGELTAVWSFFGNHGTFYSPDGVSNVFDNASCAGPTCIGAVTLSSLNVAWNGASVPMGSANGCNSSICSPEELAGDYIIDYTIGSDGQPWGIHYHNVVPDGDASSFGNVKFQFLARGVAVISNPTPAPTPTLNPFICEGNRPLPPPLLEDTSIITSVNQMVEWSVPYCSYYEDTSITLLPDYGTLTHNDCAGTYTPNSDYSGQDSFTLKACTSPFYYDVFGNYCEFFTFCDEVKVSIMVGRVPPSTPTPTLTPTTPVPTPMPTPTPAPTSCEALYPQTEITMLGKGKNLEVEETMTTIFKGHIVSTDEKKGKVTICRGSTVSYEVTSTVGTAKCSVKHGGAAESTGTLTDKGKLVCTNKPDGKDTDKFKIKRSKKKDVEVERRWFR